MTVRRVHLGDVVEVNPSAPKARLSNPSSRAAFLAMAAVSEDGSFVETERPVGEMAKGYTYFERGDILLAKITPCMENGKATHLRGLRHEFGFGSTEFHVLRPREDVDGRYLFYLVWNETFRLRAGRNMTGTAGQKRVPSQYIRTLEVPLPPLPEQRRMADILDKADAVRRKRKEAIALTEELLRSAFLEMVGPQAAGYAKWKETSLESLAATSPSAMRTGPFGSDLRHSEFVDEGVAVLGIDNAVQNRFAWGERRYITPEKYKGLTRYTVKPNDVIVTIMGTTGRSAVVPEDIPLAITTKHLATLTLNRELAEPEFVAQAIHRHPAVLGQIEQANRGAIMSGLNLGLIKSLVVRLPPKETQREFARLTGRVRLLERRLRRAEDATGALFGSLVQRAFQGDLEVA